MSLSALKDSLRALNANKVLLRKEIPSTPSVLCFFVPVEIVRGAEIV